MKNLLFLSFFVFCFQVSFAANHLFISDARAFSLGNIRSLSDELINPARISFSQQKEIGIAVLNHFQLSELNTANLYFKYPNQYLDAGVKFSTFGFEDYRISQIQFGFSKKIHSSFALGIHLTGLSEYSLHNENSRYFLSASIGFYYIVNEDLHFTGLAENCIETFDENKLLLSSGIKYLIAENSIFYLETQYEKENRFNFSLGFEYDILEQFNIRTGIQTNPKIPSLGITYKWEKWDIDAGFSFHSTLGISSMISVRFKLQ
jgi:outer membrane receptor protein involved in Fe transport